MRYTRSRNRLRTQEIHCFLLRGSSSDRWHQRDHSISDCLDWQKSWKGENWKGGIYGTRPTGSYGNRPYGGYYDNRPYGSQGYGGGYYDNWQYGNDGYGTGSKGNIPFGSDGLYGGGYYDNWPYGSQGHDGGYYDNLQYGNDGYGTGSIGNWQYGYGYGTSFYGIPPSSSESEGGGSSDEWWDFWPFNKDGGSSEASRYDNHGDVKDIPGDQPSSVGRPNHRRKLYNPRPWSGRWP